jgi:predicted metalloprotease with PDZ domain
VTPILQDGALQHLQVEMRFAGDADGVTRLALSDWGREPNPWAKVAGFDAGAAEVVQDGPRVRVMRHRPGAPLSVRYRVISAHAEDPRPETLETVFRPVIRPGWFAVYGETVFASVEGRSERPARFRWGAAPKGWRLLSDLDHAGPRTVNETANSFLMGAPDIRVVERTVRGGPLRVAFRGRFAFEDAAFVDQVVRVAEIQRRFWRDEDEAFLIAMLALPRFKDDPTGSSTNGTGRGEAYVMWGTPNIELDMLTRVLAHEQLHTWIARKLGEQSDAEETSGKWFAEGFADFYADRTLLAGGVWSLEPFVAHYNELLARYAASPARAAPAAEVAVKYWSNNAYQQAVGYDRGMLFAALLDHDLRTRSGGRLDLDDVMLAQKARAATDPEARRTRFAVDLFPIVWRETTGYPVDDLLARHIVRGEPILLPADLFGDCARVETAERPDFHRGFDLEATQKAGGVITGVRTDGPAYAAGMRDGMKLVKREPGGVNDPAVQIGYHVLDGGTERLIRYLPAGRERLEVQRVVLTEGMNAARRAACARRMSGS